MANDQAEVRAYYHEVLPFYDRELAEREHEASLGSSDPRMFVGEGIKAALREFVSLRQSAVKRVQTPSAAHSFPKGH